MSTDERPESLAAQAASWVPPWERPQPSPDRDYQASATAPDVPDEPAADEPAADEPAADEPAADEPAADGVPEELPPLPGERGGPAAVDAPAELPGDDPAEVGDEPEVPLPEPVEAAIADAGDEAGVPVVDAPVDGDDAGDVFDAAADDELSEDEFDLPTGEDVPGADENDDTDPDDMPDADDDATAEAQADEAQADEVFAAGRADAEAAFAAGAAGAGAAGAGAGTGAVGGAGAAAAGGGPSRAQVPTQGGPTSRPAPAVGALGGRTPDGVESLFPAADGVPPQMDDADFRAALEAILLVVDEPVAELQLAQILEQPAERVARMLEDISARYTAAGHGFDLRRAAGGWRLYTRPEYATYVERFVLDGQSVRLTQAALETLAVVAYKQPVTRSRISAIRGVNCDGVMRTLVTRGLIEECGTESETGAYLYRTTPLFLEKLGLNSVDQLPPLAPFLPDDVEEVLDGSG